MEQEYPVPSETLRISPGASALQERTESGEISRKPPTSEIRESERCCWPMQDTRMGLTD